MKSKLGYKRNSPDKNKPFNIIPSGRITMKEDNGTPLKKGPILGIDNLGNYEMMYPGMEYQFPGNEVFEIPMAQLGAENRKESGQKDLSYKWSEPMSKRSLPISYTKLKKGGWLDNLPKAQVGKETKPSREELIELANNAENVYNFYKNSPGYTQEDFIVSKFNNEPIKKSELDYWLADIIDQSNYRNPSGRAYTPFFLRTKDEEDPYGISLQEAQKRINELINSQFLNEHPVSNNWLELLEHANKEVNENYQERVTSDPNYQIKDTDKVYRKDLNDNVFFQRELEHGKINAEAPMQMFNKNIKPQKQVLFRNKDTNDSASIYFYDPIAVKPYDLLTSDEQKLRVNKYGIQGTPLEDMKNFLTYKITELPEGEQKGNQKYVATVVPQTYDKYGASFAERYPLTQEQYDALSNITYQKDREGNHVPIKFIKKSGGRLKKAQVGLEQNVRGKRKGDPVRDWWYNLEDVQSTYDMYPQKDSFLSDWILNPITQQKLKENLSRSVITRDINPIGLSAQAVANLRNTPVFSRELVKKTGISQSDIDYNNRLQGWQSPNTFYNNPYFSGYNSLTGTQNSGVYYPDYKQIIVNTFDNPGVLVHEGVHATGPFQEAMEDVIDHSFRDKRNPERGFIRRYGTSKLNEETGEFEYPPFEEVVKKNPLFYEEFLNEKKYLDDDGMYPRIMDIRKTLNLKPGQKVDKSILFKDEIFSPIHDLRLYYDDDTIIEILNTIAKTEKKAEELEPKAQKGGTNRTIKWLDKLQEGEEVPTIGPIDLPAVEISDKADPRALMNQGSFFGDTNNRYTTQFKETGVPQIFTDYAVAEMAKERQAAEPQLPMTLEEYQKQMGTIGLPSTDISAPFVDPNTGEVDYGKMAFAGLEGIASGFVGASTPKVPKAAVNYLQPTKLVLPPGFNPYTLGKSNKQITSTLTGSNLEKQLSKTGEINRNVILTHIGKRDTPSSDKTIIQRVLDEDFPNQSKIDYREFKKAIDNKIVSLNKDVLVDQYSNYGIQNLGYSGVSRRSYEQALKNQEMGINALTDDIAKMQKDPNYKSSTWPHYKLEDIQKLLAETIETYNKTKADLESVPESKTIKFSNKQEFGTGDAKHFPDDPYALGHSRYFINPKQPNIFNLLEVQSDFSQGSGSVLKKNLRREDYIQRKERRISSLENDVANWEKALKHMKETGTDYFGMKAYSWNIKDIEEHINYSKKRLEDAKTNFKNAEQKTLFTDSYFDRQLQESVQYAAENGQNIVRVPTRETAIKVQGYQPNTKRQKLREASNEIKFLQGDENFAALADDAPLNNLIYNTSRFTNRNVTKGEYLNLLDRVVNAYKNLSDAELDAGGYKSEHETILKKYSDQPKIIKKLFGAAPRTVTDDKGNTWYEFDIPKSYLEGKGEIKAYKLGGQKGGWLDKLQGGKEVKKKIPQGNLVKPGEDFLDISAGKKPWQRIFAEENADISRPLILGEIPIFASGVTLPNFGDLSQDEIAALQDKGPVGTAAAMKASGRYKDKGSYGESVKNFSAFPITASSQMLQTPQSVMVEGIEALRGRPYSFQNALPFSGKQRVPSETFGITNPYLGFAADVLMDPENLIPSAFAKNLMENVFKQGLKKGITTTGKNIFSSVPKFNFSNALENTKDQLSKALKGTSSIINEIKGELYQGKLNRESIKKGNEWLENWIKHPATQQKIDTDIDKRIDFIKDYFIDPTDEINTHELIRTQAKNYKPDSKEYSLLKQLDDNVQQYLSKKSRSPIHQGNWGVSYKHGYGPNTREAIELGLKKPDSRYGSWITRRVSLPQSKRVSTTIHEGAHDWVSEEAFRKSGMRNEALKHINPNIKKDLLEYENWTSIGVNPIEKMGKERAYMAYLADPTEQHARIMELRHGLDLSPDFVMDEGTASRVIDWIDKGDSKIDPKFLDVIDRDPKKLAALFNNFWAISPYITLGGLGAYGYKQYNNQAEYQKGGQKRLKKQKSGWLDNLNN